MKKFLALACFTGLLVTSCSDDDTVMEEEMTPQEPIVYTSGTADFSNYVALGNSLTAGFSDAALFRAGQEASYPNMLAQNFALAGGGEFTIPFMADDLGGATLGGQPILGNRLILSFASGSPAPVPVSGQGSTEISNRLSGPFNNMGVPGAKSYHLLAPGYGSVAGVPQGTANPYYARFASAEDATVLGDAAAQNPTFFSLWIGNNDVLGYVTAGGAGVDQTGNLDPSTYGGSDISDPMVLGGAITQILTTMTANGAKGVMANLPDVTSIPFLNTVPHNPVPLDQATADLLNGAYAAYNQALLAFSTNQNPLGTPLISPEEAQKRTISFEAGSSNPVVLLDEDLTDLTAVSPALINMRQATEEDLLVLTSQTIIGTLANPNDPTSINGVAVPLADQWVLTPEEQETANTALVAYNQIIAGLASQFDVALVDANSLLVELGTTGFTLADGSVVTADFGTGGGFSLDGVHPSPRGYAILATAFTEAINEKYGSNLPEVNPLAFTGLYLE
ncbi:GDSL-like Lipase/Acylhydrolase [Croceitalea dokdonensis DOKDO 023]|uniref:GDSL-like Lipase/Acylhydrolase n=1 Tax=Croceitalea dokdonensis DOKDO 023 TaxID=1300341 RepID=A0A0P7AWK1_9FLAO|nr:SGNH/GDSL hydrolase family protein [Croceitalea dokdonensis]KPM32467.1 GDSL-like Lipase/Acylhydrolase [Croceitalea dokdonensis DOKDO 023]